MSHQTNPARAAWLRAAYAWEQSSQPRLMAAHTRVDTRLRKHKNVVSPADGDGPSIGYLGVPGGVVKILEFLEQRREALGYKQGERIESSGRQLPVADLVAVGCDVRQAAALPRQNALLLPYRLHLSVDVSDGDRWRQAVSRRERQWLSSHRKAHDWGFELATDDASFDFFYDRMHIPTMDVRHGERTRSEPRASACECLFRRGLLGFVTMDGVRVAGVLCHRDPARKMITIRLLGVLDGDPARYDDGAMKMLYHLLLEWAQLHGMDRVDFGGTEAWLSKGIFQWKRRFSPSVTLAPNHLANLRVWWHARTDTPAVRDFLVANPVLELLDDGTLRAVYFEDAQRPARLDIAYACRTVDQSRTVQLDEFLDGAGRRPPTATSLQGSRA